MRTENADVLTILFFGKTGVGKSSTLNQLFELNWATDDAVACTKEPQYTYLDFSHYKNYDLPLNKKVRVVDMPGIAESIADDEVYLPFYEEWIPKVDSLVWVTQADTRAYKQDQIFLLKLTPLFPPSLHLTIALNKIDYLGVDENQKPFDIERREPSPDQLARLSDKVEDVYQVFKEVIGESLSFTKKQIIPYTSIYGWGLQNLKHAIITRS
jgi:predicted GTPase